MEFDAEITGVGNMPGHGPSVALRMPYRKAVFLPVEREDLPSWGSRIGERVRVRVSVSVEG